MKLGELIDALETHEAGRIVRVSKLYNIAPSSFASYRGDYAQLALGYKKIYGDVTIRGLLLLANSATGAVMEGYKGGNYRMGRDTTIMLANWGEATEVELARVEADEFGNVRLIGRNVETGFEG